MLIPDNSERVLCRAYHTAERISVADIQPALLAARASPKLRFCSGANSNPICRHLPRVTLLEMTAPVLLLLLLQLVLGLNSGVSGQGEAATSSVCWPKRWGLSLPLRQRTSKGVCSPCCVGLEMKLLLWPPLWQGEVTVKLLLWPVVNRWGNCSGHRLTGEAAALDTDTQVRLLWGYCPHCWYTGRGCCEVVALAAFTQARLLLWPPRLSTQWDCSFACSL